MGSGYGHYAYLKSEPVQPHASEIKHFSIFHWEKERDRQTRDLSISGRSFGDWIYKVTFILFYLNVGLHRGAVIPVRASSSICKQFAIWIEVLLQQSEMIPRTCSLPSDVCCFQISSTSHLNFVLTSLYNRGEKIGLSFVHHSSKNGTANSKHSLSWVLFCLVSTIFIV